MQYELLLQLRDALISLKGLLILLISMTMISSPILGGIGAITVTTELKWLRSYETIGFNTLDEDIGLDEYAIAGEKQWYIRTVPKSEGQFIVAENSADIFGKTEVFVKCERCVYYDEFSNPIAGKAIRQKSGQTKYNGLRYIKDYPQPKKSIISANLLKRAFAAIARDATSTDGVLTNVSSISWSHTNTGTNLILIFGVSIKDATDADRQVSTTTLPTYNAVNMTQANYANNDADNYTKEFWYLVNPATGANTISITYNQSEDVSYGHSVSYAGVHQTTPIDGTAGGNINNANSISTSTVTVADNAWVIDLARNNNACTGVNLATTIAGQLELAEASSSNLAAALSDKGPITPAGATSMGWDDGCNDGFMEWQHLLVRIAPAAEAEAAAPPPQKSHIIIVD